MSNFITNLIECREIQQNKELNDLKDYNHNHFRTLLAEFRRSRQEGEIFLNQNRC